MKPSSPTPSPAGPTRHAGFTLVEFIGVIAIVAILASFSIAAVHKQMIETRREAEDISLQGLAEGLSNVVRFNLTVPSSSTWAGAIAGQLNRSLTDIGTNSMGNTRAVMVDPTFQIGNPALPFSSLPFTQSLAGSRQVNNLNYVLLSSLADPLPALTGITFSNLWNSADDALPTGWPTTWKGKPEDLRRERITLTGLFYRLVLNNLDTTNSAWWGMDGSATNVTLAPGGRREFWVIDGTTLNLCDSTAALTARDILHADASYIFMNNRWVQSIVPIASVGGGTTETLVETVDGFVDAIDNTAEPGSGGGTGPSYDDDHDCDHDGWDDHDDDHDNYDDDDDDHDGWDDHDSDHNGRCDHDDDHDGWGDHDYDHDGWEDDDHSLGSTRGCNPKANPRTVVESCFNFMRSFTTWSKNHGCSKTGRASVQYEQVCAQREQVRAASNSCP
jgi:prepilin-type N-terminal cleavage/methylation domain-containing protein